MRILNRAYRIIQHNDDGLPVLDLTEENDDGLPMISKKKEGGLSGVGSGVGGSSIGKDGLFTRIGKEANEVVDEQKIKDYVYGLKTDEEKRQSQSAVLSPENVVRETHARLMNDPNFDSNDPVKYITGKVNEKQEPVKEITTDIAKDIQVRKAMSDMAKQPFGTESQANEYLGNVKNIPVDQLRVDAGDNLTKQKAVDRIEDFRKVENAFEGGKRTLEDAAINYAISNGDEQAAYLKEKGGYLGIPPAMKGEKILQFLMNPDLRELGEHNPQLKQEIRNTILAFPNHHPEYAVKLLAQAIADKREKEGYNNWFANVVGKETTDKMVDELVADGTFPGTYKLLYQQRMRPKLGTWNSIGRGFGNAIPGINQLVNEAPIPTPGALENFEEGFENFQTGTAKSIANLTGIQYALQPQAQQVYNTLEKQYSTPAFEPSSWQHKISMHGGQLAGFIPGFVGGTGALKSISLLKNPAVASGAMFVLATHGDNMEKAKTLFPKNDIKQVLYTGTMDIANGTLGKLLPGQQIPKLLSKAEPAIADALKAMVDGKITTEAAKSTITNAIGNSIKGSLSGGEFMGAIAGIDDLTTQLLQGKGIDFSQTMDKTWDSFKTGLLATAPLATFEAALKSNKRLKSEIISMAANPEHYKEVLKQEAEKDPEVAKLQEDIISNLDHISKVYAESKLPQKEKEQFVLDSLREKIKLNQAENATDPTIKKRLQKEAKDISEIKEASLNGVPEEKVRMNQVAKEVKEFYNNGYLSKVANEMLETKKTEESEGKFDEAKVESFLKEVAANPKKQVPARIRELAEEMYPISPKEELESVDKEDENPFKDSVIKKPLFHSSKVDFEEFKPTERGVYFSSRPDYMTAFMMDGGKSFTKGGKRYEAFLDVKNPLNISFDPANADALNEAIPRAKKEGYDSVVLTDTKTGDIIEAVVFNKDQIKIKSKKSASSEEMSEVERLNKEFDELEKKSKPEINEVVQENIESVKPQSSETQSPTTGTTPEVVEPAKQKGEGDLTGITHAQMNEIAEEFGLPTYEKDPQTVKEWDAEAAKRIRDNPNSINELMNRMRNEGMPSPVEQRMMLQYISGLRAKMRANPTPETLRELNRAKDISNIVGGRFVGQSLVARKGMKPTEDTLDGYLTGWTEAHGTETLSQEVITRLTERFNKEEALKMSVEEAYQKGREEALNEKASENISKQAAHKKEKKKDFKQERASLKEELKKATEEHRKWLKDQGIQQAGIGFSLTTKEAKIIAKIAKSYASESINKLGELIEKVYEEIKDVFPEVTKKDIRDVIADVYTEKKETRNDLTEKWRNFKTEADLLNKIEQERKGLSKDKTTSGQIKKTARIEELQKKYKEVQKLNKEKSKSEKEPVEDVSAMDDIELAKYKKQKLSQIENLRERIATKDYTEQEAPSRRIKLDKEARKLEAEYEKMKEQDVYEQEKAKYDRLSKATKTWDKVWKVLGLKRIMQTALDFSIPFRQNITTTINPLKWLPRVEDGKLKTPTNVRQFKNMFAFTFVPRLMREYMKNLKQSGEYGEMKEDGIVFSDPHELKGDKRDEEFRNNIFQSLQELRGDKNEIKHLASYVGEPIFASERAAAGALNTIRVERYRSAKRNLERQGVTRENDPEAYKKMAEWVMNMTGRGKMLEMIEKSKTGKTLAGNTFYGARLFASRINLLKNPFFSKMPKEVRVEAFKDMTGFVSGVMMTGLALMAAGGKVSFDPDDPDFLQVSFGNTKYDITGGMAAYIRTFLRITKTAYKQGEAVIDPSKRKEANNYAAFTGRTGTSFITNKFAPNTAYAYHFITGKSPGYDDKKFHPEEFFQFYPMYVEDIKDAWAEQGVSSLFSIGLPNIFGIGTNTYESKEKEAPSSTQSSSRNSTRQHKAD